MAGELTYESAFPGRFLKAALFDGKRVTVTVESAFLEVLEGEKGKENKLILTFVGKTMQLVFNKTNAVCMREMFGNKISLWIGKRVVLYPTRVAFGPKQVDAIRVYGSPDIDEDIEVAARIGRKNFKATMVAVKGAKGSSTTLDPRIMAAFAELGYTKAEQEAFIAHNSDADQSELLSRLQIVIEERNKEEQ